MTNSINYIISFLLVAFISCAKKEETNTYVSVNKTTDPYDLDGREMMVTKNITMQPRTFINTVTNDSVTIIHHIENTGFHVYNAVVFADEKKGVIVGGAGLKIRTTLDGGLHWQENQFSKFANPFHDTTIKNDTIFAVGESQYIYRSTDFGKHWEIYNSDRLIAKSLNIDKKDHLTEYNPRYYKIKFYNNTGIVIGDYDRIRKIKPILLKTIDNGKSWQILKTNGLLTFESGISDIAMLSEKVLYIVTIKGNCYKSTDGGNHWKLRYRNIDTPLYSIDFLNENEGFIGGVNTTLWHTITGGEIWEKVPLKLDKHLNISNIQFTNNQKVIFSIASQSVKLEEDFLYQFDIKTKVTKSIFRKKDTSVVFKGSVYGLYKQLGNSYVLDRNNLYKLKKVPK